MSQVSSQDTGGAGVIIIIVAEVAAVVLAEVILRMIANVENTSP